jgi:hypothetical protein
MPTDLAKLADAVEAAWNQPFRTGLLVALEAWLAARRAARTAGFVECLLSREAVEALTKAHYYVTRTGSEYDPCLAEHWDAEAVKLLAAALLKEPT